MTGCYSWSFYLKKNTFTTNIVMFGIVPDLQLEGCRFESRSGILRTNRSTQPSIPPGSVNVYQLRLGRQRQVWLIPIADERVGVQEKM